MSEATSPQKADDQSTPTGVRRDEWRSYVKMMRPQQWFKQVLVVAGMLIALWSTPTDIAAVDWLRIAGGVFAACLLASSNYLLNELLDAAGDAVHPRKSQRPAVQQSVEPLTVCVVWMLTGLSGLIIAFALGGVFLAIAISFWLLALAYNVAPIRLKDRPVWDILCEGLNSPLRFLMGWSLVTPQTAPAVSLLLTFWAAGAAAMTYKRFAELQEFPDQRTAAAYRRSFAHYNVAQLGFGRTVFVLIAVLGSVLFLLGI